MKIKIPAARLSFPSLFKMSSFGGESTGKYEATFILDKVDHAETIKQIKDAIGTMMRDTLKSKLTADKICLKDGDESGRAELVGKMTIKANTKKRPIVINRDKTPIAEEDNVVYAGCYANGIISLWVQNNNFGKRINAQLDGVQFVKDGEPFGDGAVSVSEFDAFGEDDGFSDDDFDI